MTDKYCNVCGRNLTFIETPLRYSSKTGKPNKYRDVSICPIFQGTTWRGEMLFDNGHYYKEKIRNVR